VYFCLIVVNWSTENATGTGPERLRLIWPLYCCLRITDSFTCVLVAGAYLKAALINQHYYPPDLLVMFDPIDPPDLNLLFEKKKPRFNKRTSSAHWDSPILKKPAQSVFWVYAWCWLDGWHSFDINISLLPDGCLSGDDRCQRNNSCLYEDVQWICWFQCDCL
jgi:hypothetical protein